jgi:DNA-binding NarL/FixJ family response regulator
VVLLDVQLPDSDGFDVARELSRGQPPPAVVLVSSRPRSDYGRLVERSGVRGFIDKAELSGPRLRQELDATGR